MKKTDKTLKPPKRPEVKPKLNRMTARDNSSKARAGKRKSYCGE